MICVCFSEWSRSTAYVRVLRDNLSNNALFFVSTRINNKNTSIHLCFFAFSYIHKRLICLRYGNRLELTGIKYTSLLRSALKDPVCWVFTLF